MQKLYNHDTNKDEWVDTAAIKTLVQLLPYIDPIMRSYAKAVWRDTMYDLAKTCGYLGSMQQYLSTEPAREWGNILAEAARRLNYQLN